MQIFLYLLSTMTHTFYKYQGTGNDFIIIDNRQGLFDKKDAKSIATLCDRRFGIGADGLILLENHPDYDFKMVYYNADGNESSMCGNGGRCIVAFARALSIIDTTTTFEAVDGLHEATIDEKIVSLKMQDVDTIRQEAGYTFLDTGSPHHIELSEQLKVLNVKEEGASIRYSDLYGQEGSNVNFVQVLDNSRFAVRTYERGVEDETLSCGTGVTAVALAMHATGKTAATTITIDAEGGELQVRFRESKKGYTDIWLIGEAKFVFKGHWEW